VLKITQEAPLKEVVTSKDILVVFCLSPKVSSRLSFLLVSEIRLQAIEFGISSFTISSNPFSETQESAERRYVPSLEFISTSLFPSPGTVQSVAERGTGYFEGGLRRL